MPEHDDLADALSRMSRGEVEDSHASHVHADPPATPVTPAPVKAPVRAAAPKAAAPAPRAAAPAAAPLSPGPAPAARPTRPSAPGTPARPTTPQMATVPTPAIPAKPQRPSAPTIRAAGPAVPPPPIEEDLGASPAEQEIFDDDAVIVPAPDASVFNPKPKAITTADARAKIAAAKRLNFKRTTIPVLLTLGAWMFVFASMKYWLGQDSPMAQLQSWVPIMLGIAGAVLLVFAVMNMLSVKAQMQRR